MPNVYIPNNSGHDFTQAEEFGTLIFITQGMIDRFKINSMYREVADALMNSTDEDYIMVTGLTQINVVLAGAFARKHGRLNLLIYDVKEGRYIPRKIMLDNLLLSEE